jgi:heme-degrading monooxygenase HmoA
LLITLTFAGREVHMYARVWKLSILPGKVEQFVAACNAVIPILRQQPGFRVLVVLRGGSGERLEATVVSAWESLDQLRASETSAYQQAVVSVLSCCELRPFMGEEEVLLSEFASPEPSDTTLDYKRPIL